MPNLIKYWAGEIKADEMERDPQRWFDAWLINAIKSRKKESLIVFRIPLDKNGMWDKETLVEIETLLQKKFSDES